jgi:hypothetical protein
MKHVFISYVREDTPTVDKLVSELESRGHKVWLDRNDIGVGLHWADAIKKAIGDGSFFLACFSKQYHNRNKTYMNEELTLAVEELRLRPTDRAWFIPVRLDECEIPDRSIGGGKTLKDIQHADLFANWEFGLVKILSALGSRKDTNGHREPKKSLEQVAREFYGREKSPYREHIRTKGRRLVEFLLPLPELLHEENQKWLLWELFQALLEKKNYNCTLRLGQEETGSGPEKLFYFLLFDRWSETRHRAVLRAEEAQGTLWAGAFDTLVDTRVSAAGMQREKHRFSWRGECSPATRDNPFIGEDVRPLLNTLLGKTKGLDTGEQGSFLYDLQQILMGSFGRGLKFVFGLGRNDMCNQASPLLLPEHDESSDMLVLEIWDTFFRSLKYTCVCSKHWSRMNEAGVNLMNNESEIWLGLA